MATREKYRDDLNDKILGLEDEGYGDFEYTDPELNTYLELAVIRLYPAVYARKQETDKEVTGYGTRTLGYVDTDYADRVYLVEETTELEPIGGWHVRGNRIANIDTDIATEVNLYYHDAYILPTDDVTDAGIPDRYGPLIVLGALVEALESRHDTGIRGDPQPHGYHSETQLIDRLTNRYAILKDEMAMALPGVYV